MDLLATIDNDGKIIDKSDVSSTYQIRNAARAVVFDDKKQVALLYVSKYGYYKLPGGGVDEGEEIEAALKREIKEEIGFDSKIISKLGQTHEYWDDYKEFQTSFCFVANVVGPQGNVEFTENEINHGFKVVWAESLDKAIKILEDAAPKNYEGKIIKARDLVFLRRAKS